MRNLRFLLETPLRRAAGQPAGARAICIGRWPSSASAAAIVETEDIDVIHSHFGWPGSFGGVLARAPRAGR